MAATPASKATQSAIFASFVILTPTSTSYDFGSILRQPLRAFFKLQMWSFTAVAGSNIG
jgi:hypothetical protein